MGRKVPDLNSSSTADMAFLLLIFFLIATTMNVDSGIQRVLPAWPDPNQQDPGRDVNERNLMFVSVNPSGRILVNRTEVIDISMLKDRVIDFVLNPTNASNRPERVMTEIDIIGNYPVSKGIVSLQNDRGTNYGVYIMVQNELTKAFNELRDQASNQKFGKKFAELDEPQSRAIQKAVPMSISEAEPRDLTGK